MSDDEFQPRSQRDYGQYLKELDNHKRLVNKQFIRNPQSPTFKPKIKSESFKTPVTSQKVVTLKFEEEKEQLGKRLFSRFNKKVFDSKLPSNTCLRWIAELPCNRAGFCKNKKGSSKIFLSSKIVDSPEKLKNTLIHEMCHAANWLINKKSDGHGPNWLGWARRAISVFPELTPIKKYQWYQIGAKYSYRCLNASCGYIFQSPDLFDTKKLNCNFCGSIIQLDMVNDYYKNQDN